MKRPTDIDFCKIENCQQTILPVMVSEFSETMEKIVSKKRNNCTDFILHQIPVSSGHHFKTDTNFCIEPSFHSVFRCNAQDKFGIEKNSRFRTGDNKKVFISKVGCIFEASNEKY